MYGNVEGSNYWMIKTFLISYFIHFYFYSESMTAVMFMEGHVRGQWGKVSCFLFIYSLSPMYEKTGQERRRGYLYLNLIIIIILRPMMDG